ncbi:MAG: tetratricopeptide repeat protein [Lentisphaerae bacterium]|nr:tetratricopeptide repeat protein [Lentisphaerota bacterium]
MRHFALIMLLCAALRPAMGADLTEEERFDLANGLYSRGMHELAVKEYRTLLRDFPSSKDVDTIHFRLGESFRRIGRHAEAEEHYRTVFEQYASSRFRYKAGFRRAGVFMDSGRYGSAIDMYDALIQAGPPKEIQSASHYFTGKAYASLGKTNDAVSAFVAVKDRYAETPFYSYALLALAGIKSGRGEKDAALKLYADAASKPASARVGAEALFQMAETCFRNGDFERSAETYDRLLKTYPSDMRSEQAPLQAAWASHNAGRYTTALARTVAALAASKLEKKDEWLYLRANCERQLVRNANAVSTYSGLLKKFPDSRFANATLYEKALVYYKMGRFKDAVAAASTVETGESLKKDVYWLLAESFSSLDDYDSAVQYYRLIVKEFPDSDVTAEAAFKLAHSLQERGDYRAASRYYGMIATRFSSHGLASRALFASAYCLAKEGMHEEAARDWAALVRTYPTHPLVEESLFQQAMSEMRLGRDEATLATLGDLLRRFPKSLFTVEARYWRGVLLNRSDQGKEAVEELRLALAAAPGKEMEREIQFALALSLQKAGAFPESASLLETVLKTPKADGVPPNLLQWLAEYRFGEKKYAESVAAARALAGREKGDAWRQAGWTLVGRGLRVAGDEAGARDAFQKALQIAAGTPFEGEAALRLGDIAYASKTYDKARDYFERAAGLAMEHETLAVRANAYAGLARSLRALSQPAAAARYFMSVAVLYDDPVIVPECLHGAAAALHEIGRKEEARQAALELRKRYPDSGWAKRDEVDEWLAADAPAPADGETRP